jgi:hypothetical protein
MRERLSFVAFIAVVSAMVVTSSPAARAAAAGGDRVFVQRLFGGPADPQKSYACFARTYDASHLAYHPRKKVSAMKLLVTAEPEPESRALVYSFRLSLQYRDRRGVFNSSGECGHAETAGTGRFGCGVDCDGGGIEVALAKNDKSILVKVERSGSSAPTRPTTTPARNPYWAVPTIAYFGLTGRASMIANHW